MGTIHTRFVWWPSVIIVSLTLDVICLAETRDPFHGCKIVNEAVPRRWANMSAFVPQDICSLHITFL